jgi:hypothetical protein
MSLKPISLKRLICGCVFRVPEEYQTLPCGLTHQGAKRDLLEKMIDLQQALQDIEVLLRAPGPGTETASPNVDKAWSIAHQYGKRL